MAAARKHKNQSMTLGEIGFDQLIEEMGRRLTSIQQDQVAFLSQQNIPAHVGNKIKNMQNQMAEGLRGFASAMAKTKDPKEKTRRVGGIIAGATGPDGRSAVLNRPVDWRRITDTQRRDMLLFPPIAIGLAARIAPVVGSFASWSPECSDAMQRAVIKAQLSGKIHKMVDDACHGAYAYGFAPFELVWKNADLDMELVEGDDEDLVIDSDVYHGFAKPDPSKPAADPSAPKPPVAAVPPKTVTRRLVNFAGATVLDKAKDLKPTLTEILVSGRLQEFAGLRYMADADQELNAMQSLVVTHNGRYGQMYGNSVLDNVYAPWYVIEVVTQLCNMYLERKGDPPYKGYAPLIGSWDASGNIVHGYTVMVDGINQLRGGGGIVMPSDVDPASGMRKYDLEAMKEDPRVEIFVRWIEHMIRMIFWGMLIPDGSIWQNSRVGSFAAAQTYADVAVVLREIDLRWIESYINRYVVERVLALNFAAPRTAIIQAKTRPDVKVAMLKDILVKCLDLKTEPGQMIWQMIDWRDLLKQTGTPSV